MRRWRGRQQSLSNWERTPLPKPEKSGVGWREGTPHGLYQLGREAIDVVNLRIEDHQDFIAAMYQGAQDLEDD